MLNRASAAPASETLPLVAERLSDRLAARLGGQIDAGALRPGDRLPTEQRLAEAHGVSRTVVREAVHQLRSRGLVRSRQGSGVYVTAAPSGEAFTLDLALIDSIDDVLRVREVRRALEAETAALAAERASRKQVATVRAALRDIDRVLRGGEGAVTEDFAFHRAIAEATGNAQFPRFLAFLGSHIIPRQSVRLSVETPAQRRAYLERIQHEHVRIVAGIAAADPAEARRAMRDHLTRSLERYRKLAEGSKP